MRFCSERCVAAHSAVDRTLAKVHDVDYARSIRMFIADPWGLNLYRRGFVLALILFVLVLLWQSLDLMGRSQRQHHIQEKGMRHGVVYETEPVGTGNLK